MIFKRKPKTNIMEIKTDIFNGKPKKVYVETPYTSRKLQKISPEFENDCTKLKHTSQGIILIEKGVFRREQRILTGAEADKVRRKLKR